jgi:NADPH-dependent curcumin reductase CurA
MEAVEALMGWVASGEVTYEVDMQEGFDNIPDTLQRLYTGKNFGKQLLKLADPE